MNNLDRLSITYIRVLATLMILLCHLVVTFNNALLQKSAMFFNVGVYVFIIISGYLYGKKDILKKNSSVKWFIGRYKRIQLPIYIFLLCLMIIYIIKNKELNTFNWLINVVGLQGLEIYLNGAEHLWYITVILLCYLVTPLLNKIKSKNNKSLNILLFVSLIIIQIIITLFINKQIGIYLILFILYYFSYFVGHYTNSEKIQLKHFIVLIVMLMLAIIIRLVGLVLFDATILYDVFIVGYTHSILAIGIFFSVFYIIKNYQFKYLYKIVKEIDSISYEIYIVHYMLIVGPLNIMVTNNNILNCFIVLVATYVLAKVLNKITKLLVRH